MIDSGECEHQCLIKLSNCGYCEIFFFPFFPLNVASIICNTSVV